ncbi:NAD-dependent epimerase/dehydratase family protein [Evansella halocellulosilytica]|uniref:NAD-dependent epimerase/dehydratase family protein n=1 Tax=Evansella halocellulosilytica TaxID=2011013 RepID=UPI00211CC21E|nr:NAD-dependent epimerase/dehydratase family protein [Evansella halocellulosilytica]
MKKALIAGATGLIGKQLVRELIAGGYYSEVHILSRKQTSFNDQHVIEHVIDYDSLEQYDHLFESIDDVFICLGTTMKKAKTKKQFIKVDYVYPTKIAELSQKAGVKKLLVVSAIGSDRESRFFYNRVKGKLEEALVILNLPSLHIFRPSLLIGEREEFRLGEQAAAYFTAPVSFLLAGPLEKYKPVKGKDVAAVMRAVAQEESRGVHIYESDKIRHLGKVLMNK